MEENVFFWVAVNLVKVAYLLKASIYFRVCQL